MGIIWLMMVNNNLVGGGYLPLWKMMEWKSLGMMTFPRSWKVIKFMFQTTTLYRFAQRTALGQEDSTLVCGIRYGEREAFVTGMGSLSDSQDCLRKGPTENNCSHRSTAPSHWAHQGITRQQANKHTKWLAGLQKRDCTRTPAWCRISQHLATKTLRAGSPNPQLGTPSGPGLTATLYTHWKTK